LVTKEKPFKGEKMENKKKFRVADLRCCSVKNSEIPDLPVERVNCEVEYSLSGKEIVDQIFFKKSAFYVQRLTEEYEGFPAGSLVIRWSNLIPSGCDEIIVIFEVVPEESL
jgi:hypothetical protein